MSAGFTPGPWRIEENGGGKHWGMREVVGPRCRVVGFTIATDVTFEQGRQTDADARLIAAAPELYEALAEMVRDAERAQRPGGGDTVPAKAYLALAKTRGDQ